VTRLEELRGDPPEDEEWPDIEPKTVTVKIPNNIFYKLL
jgi:hypothetical protein